MGVRYWPQGHLWSCRISCHGRGLGLNGGASPGFAETSNRPAPRLVTVEPVWLSAPTNHDIARRLASRYRPLARGRLLRKLLRGKRPVAHSHRASAYPHSYTFCAQDYPLGQRPSEKTEKFEWLLLGIGSPTSQSRWSKRARCGRGGSAAIRSPTQRQAESNCLWTALVLKTKQVSSFSVLSPRQWRGRVYSGCIPLKQVSLRYLSALGFAACKAQESGMRRWFDTFVERVGQVDRA